MIVAQRSGLGLQTLSGYGSVDRFKGTFAQVSVTQTQSDVASGTTPYNLGFRKAIKLANTSTSTNAGALATINYYPEAQDLANSGWNYTSTSSYITLSFWVKSSLAGTYYVNIFTEDTTQQNFPYSFALSADTWTKVTKTIPGNSNITINNDNGAGMEIKINAFLGTGAGASSGSPPTLGVWAAKDGSHRLPVFAQDWCNTGSATFEVTGVQLEVGDVATDFEHRSYGDELHRCRRYYQVFAKKGANPEQIGPGYGYTSGQFETQIQFNPTMRSAPSVEIGTGTDYYKARTGGTEVDFNSLTAYLFTERNGLMYKSSLSGLTEGNAYRLESGNASAYLHFQAEL
tara:strand:- start:91 stop:1122 length:1032 start_codon:yes stop_codon:yes gene_type:complete